MASPGREVCCIEYQTFLELLNLRKSRTIYEEDQLVVLVTMPKNRAFRVYVNSPGRKNLALDPMIMIRRNRFPDIVVS